MNSVEIRQVSNGYVVDAGSAGRSIFVTTEALFEYLLQMFEGRTLSFGGDMYGKVTIEREKPE